MISMTSSSASRCDPVWPSWSFRSSSISIMCRRKQRPPSRKRPLSWGRRPKRSLDSLKNRWERPRSGGSLYMEPRKAPRKSVDPYEHGHIWRIISHSQTSQRILLLMHPIWYPIIYPIWSPILCPKLHPNYIPMVFFLITFSDAPVCYSPYCCLYPIIFPVFLVISGYNPPSNPNLWLI